MMMERERFPHPALMAHEEFIRYINIALIFFIYNIILYYIIFVSLLKLRNYTSISKFLLNIFLILLFIKVIIYH